MTTAVLTLATALLCLFGAIWWHAARFANGRHFYKARVFTVWVWFVAAGLSWHNVQINKPQPARFEWKTREQIEQQLRMGVQPDQPAA